MKHTKGEWTYQVWESESDPQCTVYSDVAGRTKIADVGFFKHTLATQEESEANAKLIAAAPELLKSLNHAMKIINILCPKELPEHDLVTIMRNEYKSLIQKATDDLEMTTEND